MRADAKLWRFAARDRQLTLVGKELRPLLAPDFQAIVGNPQIEEACAAFEDVADTEEKMRLIKERLGVQQLSQLHAVVNVKKGEGNDIDLLLEEFRVVVAAPTVTALAKILKHVNTVKDKVMPQMMLAEDGKKEEVQPMPEPVQKQPPQPAAAAVTVPVEGVASKTSFRGKLKNIVVMLPETVITRVCAILEIGKRCAGTSGEVFAHNECRGKRD